MIVIFHNSSRIRERYVAEWPENDFGERESVAELVEM
jgi:hypothetical protein